MKYIVEFEDEPCMYEDDVHFYKCVQAPWWGLSERVIERLTPYQPEPDCVSRQAAIDAISEYGTIWMSYTDDMSASDIAQEALNSAKDTMIRILKELPAVQPEHKTGRWMFGFNNQYLEKYYYCSNCGCRKHTEDEPSDYFCPNCGADMRGGDSNE